MIAQHEVNIQSQVVDHRDRICDVVFCRTDHFQRQRTVIHHQPFTVKGSNKCVFIGHGNVTIFTEVSHITGFFIIMSDLQTHILDEAQHFITEREREIPAVVSIHFHIGDPAQDGEIKVLRFSESFLFSIREQFFIQTACCFVIIQCVDIRVLRDMVNVVKDKIQRSIAFDMGGVVDRKALRIRQVARTAMVKHCFFQLFLDICRRFREDLRDIIHEHPEIDRIIDLVTVICVIHRTVCCFCQGCEIGRFFDHSLKCFSCKRGISPVHRFSRIKVINTKGARTDISQTGFCHRRSFQIGVGDDFAELNNVHFRVVDQFLQEKVKTPAGTRFHFLTG